MTMHIRLVVVSTLARTTPILLIGLLIRLIWAFPLAPQIRRARRARVSREMADQRIARQRRRADGGTAPRAHRNSLYRHLPATRAPRRGGYRGRRCRHNTQP